MLSRTRKIKTLSLLVCLGLSGTVFASASPTTPLIQENKIESVLAPKPATTEAAKPDNAVKAQFAKSGIFSPTTVMDLAKQLALKPYQAPDESLPDALKNLDYNQYNDIRFRPDEAIWQEAKLPYQMQMFHRGFYYKNKVELALVNGNLATHLAYNPEYFRTGSVFTKPLPKGDIGYSGFRLHYPLNRADYYDELLVFQGATYFRALGKNDSYGLSARGLALRTADPEGEEIPVFKAFWIEEPQADSNLMVIYALLDSPSVSGAYRFSVRPGDSTQMDVEAVLYPRVDLQKVGLAPETSMFKHSLNGRQGIDDFRPEVHNSDGLLMLNGRSERLWRPLANPTNLQVSAFMDNAPQGFGLVQRQRDFDAYQDLDANFEKRPSLWVEPLGNWGQGAVVLTEIPSQAEIHDNIVMFWRPKDALKAGGEYRFAYRLSWGNEPQIKPGTVTVQRTASGRADISKPTSRRLFVIDYQLNGGKRPPVLPAAKVESNVGVISNIVVRENTHNGGYRLSFEFDPAEANVAELRAELQFDGQNPNAAAPGKVETWLYRWSK
ncbi:glucan biosynthesis protein D [Shewanella mangrovi]|uniref:Glucan biosynthesis protein D n=1 Tax=Shewanella mangrovi TaxID=1515746 RepID=A0A094LTE2_9GAMM|nr:glucan biosynthesis protein G [Shewanella mangrovi]KFZ38468.1 glucan biosynthesis protein D [Shewanella mangrovi]